MKKRRVHGIVAVAMVLLVALCTTGCSDRSEELKKEVTGIWQVDSGGDADASSLKASGFSTFYLFDEDGTFTMSSLVMGATADRVGSWEVKDGQVVVNVPELKEQSSDVGPLALKLSGPAIQDAAVTVDEDVLTVEINSMEKRAKRITQEQHDKIVEASEAMGPQQIALNQQVDNEGCSFTVTSLDFMEEIYPDDTSGYYQYYEDEAGSSYLVARVDVTNTHNEYIGLGHSTQAQFILDGNKYGAEIEVIDGSLMSSALTLDPQQSASMYIFASIPDSMKGAKDIKLSWKLPESASMLNRYFSPATEVNTYELVK